MMRYYPVSLNIKDRKCLVVGGGSVGTRKVSALIRCGAIVTVVSPDMSDTLYRSGRKNTVTLKKRCYRSSDLDDVFLVFGTTDNMELNRQIGRDARQRNILCNIADSPAISDFVLPATMNRGDLCIAVSTSGKSPALARRLRRKLEGLFGEEYAPFLNLMGAVREKLLKEQHNPEMHKSVFEQLIDGNLLEMVKIHDINAVNAILQKILGEAIRYEDLINQGSDQPTDK